MMKKTEIILANASKLYQNYQYDEALKVFDTIPKLDKNTIQARSLKAIILVDRWDGNIHCRNEIFEAINHLEFVLEKDPKNKTHHLYNLGNAYQKLTLFDLMTNKGKLNPEIIEHLEKVKGLFEESLSIDDNQPEVWINLGNTFNDLGRYLEGIECYDNAIVRNPTHYNAWAARGTCSWHLSTFVTNEQDKKLLWLHAMTFLKMEYSLNPNNPINPSLKKTADDFFEANKIKFNPERTLKKLIPRKKGVLGSKFNYYKESSEGFQEFYQKFCEDNGLFLNVHFDCHECSCKSLDLIDFRFITSIHDNKRSYELMKKWFALRDDYKTARVTLALSHFRHKDLIFLDKQRYEPDYSLNYLFNIESLKQSFVLIMNIYDKIALLLNDYEELGLDDSKVNFWGDTIFTQTDLLEKNSWNRHLVAMDSIRRDLEGRSSTDNKFKKMADIRNYITHRYFNLHDIVDLWNPELILHI
ncbi:MAG: LA2681 family HEPN domain-containing protein [Methanoregula sp.]